MQKQKYLLSFKKKCHELKVVSNHGSEVDRVQTVSILGHLFAELFGRSRYLVF
jgi:hypothetical protein